jgi:2-methylaconitate cis-trans-isomerase PrpF
VCAVGREIQKANVDCKKEIGEYAYCAGAYAIGRGTMEQAQEANAVAVTKCASQLTAMTACTSNSVGRPIT